ncbi:class I adenylate-forming enzyme family protein [Massilia sp. 9096]|uniref:class I adenylate-forming enzyme family protein n=1 Tax=Massilia sp. 9096 TaxID=1500894 RepID=UPI00055AF63A|nr:AMP-binding protein [Massilia sp. 9096]
MIDVSGLLASLPARIDAVPRLHAVRTPDAPALAELGRTLSYRQLTDAIDRLAGLLREHGVRPGDRVLLVSENCAAQVAAIFAAAALEAWIVNVNARLSAPELQAIRAHSGARLALYTSAVSPDAHAHAALAGAQAMADAALGEFMIGSCDPGAMPEPAGPEPVAALVYTTGTTGQPKGVMLSHRNLLYVAAVSSRLRGLAPQDRAWGVLPVSHVYGLTSVMLGTLYAGACLQLAPRFTPEGMLAAIRDEGLTIVQGVPAMYARLLEHLGGGARPAPTLRSTLRFAYAGGSPLDPALKRQVEAALGVPLHNGYGLTEAAPTVSQTRLAAPRADTSVGYPIPGVEARLVGRDGKDAGAEPGALWVRGPNVMQGYYRAPDLTAQALRPDGWLDTGDLARRDPDGALFIVGRTRELIIRSGFNVFPLEVETVLNAHPAVTQSAVVGRALAGGEEDVVAFVQPAPRARVTPQELRAWAAARLAPYKRPTRIVLMDSLPAAATGKVLKHVLKAMADESETDRGP